MLGRNDVHEGGLLADADAGRRAGTRSEPAAPRQTGSPPRRPENRAPAQARVRSRRRAYRAWLATAFLVAAGSLLALDGSAALGAVVHPARGLAPGFRTALNALRGPVRIGLQVGHLDETGMPRELARLRAATGAEVDGLDEVDVNRAIVRALAGNLREDGFRVDILGATVPPGYRATLVLAVHADASPDPHREGYKSAHYLPLRNRRDLLLKLDVDRAVLRRTRLGDDDANVSLDMLEYYAFNARRFRHAVARGTPALIVEMGYLSNRHDRALLEHPAALAAALADGIVTYLHDVQRIAPGAPGAVRAAAGPGRAGKRAPTGAAAGGS